jgi:phosphoglycolate phosphatase
MGEAASVSRSPSRLLPDGLMGLRPSALLLDFDGVIVDSVALKTDAFRKIYARESPEKLAAMLDYQRSHGGVTRRLKFRYFESELFGRPVSDEGIEALSAAYTRLVHDAVLACPLIPGALAFLESALGKSTLHVVSGTPQEELEDIVRRRDLRRYFSSLHGAPVTKLGAFREIVNTGGHAPQRVLAIGDATTEYDAAITLGIPFLGVLPPNEPSPFPADVPVVRSLEMLGEALGFA